MSGDVQPRKRKDKKRKRDDEDIKEHHHGVHATKMGSDDVHLHIQEDHHTGGHWCAKLFFFSLLAILLGLIGLIILENRGLSDLDTPLSESRFSEYFDGWVDEHRTSHDDHIDKVAAALEDHEHDAEPFDEEEDTSEQAEDDGHDDEEKHGSEDDEEDHEDEEEDHDDEEEDDQEVAGENDEYDEDEAEAEEQNKETDDNDDEENANEEDEEDESLRVKRDIDQADPDEGFEDAEDDDGDDDENEANDNDADEDENEANEAEQPDESLSSHSRGDQDPFDEEDDFDDDQESIEEVVDNDAGEFLHLQEKAKQEEESVRKAEPIEEEEYEGAPLGVKIAVGLALAFVARLVLVKKKLSNKTPKTDFDEEFLDEEPIAVRRRLTMIKAEDNVPLSEDEDEEELLEEEYIEEAEEEEAEEEREKEAIFASKQYSEEENIDKFIPETFEQLNAMYRPKNFQIPKPEKIEEIEEIKPMIAPTRFYRSPVALKMEEKPQPKEEPQIVPSYKRMDYEQTVRNPEYDEGDPEEDIYDDDEEMEEEEDEIDEEEISDVDDDDLMKRLEAKYGKLPQTEYDDGEEVEDHSWTKIKSRPGGGPQRFSEESFIDDEVNRANEEMLQNNLKSALKTYESLILTYNNVPGALYGKAKVLDRLSEKYLSNEMLNEAIASYETFLGLGDKISDVQFKEVGERCIERMRFIGKHLDAVKIHKMLIKRFKNDPYYRNQLAVTFLLVNRLKEAKYVLHKTLLRWQNDGFAQAHYGFVLKNLDQNYEHAAYFLQNGINSGANGTQDGRFYFNLGDALHRLARTDEAMEVYRQGAEKGLFPSKYQRSLYNAVNLKAQPFWTKADTTYEEYLNILEKNWEAIRDEGLSVLTEQGYFQDESENLKDTGDWKQFELYARGSKNLKNCLKTPLTCQIIDTFPAARSCRRGQIKFSVIHPGTHVWPHCGPTNCRLRAHLGLRVPIGTALRVAQEKKTWKEGEFLIFDDSFEHEVWHNGTSIRLVLIVDVWHPDLTEYQRNNLSAI